jgi:excisionase family DNA binding protein
MSNLPGYAELRTVQEVARYFRVDDTTVRRWIKKGAMEAVALPKRGLRQAYRIKVTTVQKYDSDYEGQEDAVK